MSTKHLENEFIRIAQYYSISIEDIVDTTDRLSKYYNALLIEKEMGVKN